MDRFLMCPPDYFGIEYEINPWMRISNQADPLRACEQWRDLHRVLTGELGASVELMEPVEGLPDLVFTANAGYVEGNLFVSSTFKHKERQGETPLFEAWFRSRGYRISKLSPHCIFEGAGDALLLGETIFAGYRHRSEICSHQELGEITRRRVISLELADPWFYHLDTCFCPLDGKSALYFPGAFDDYARKALQENVPDLLPVSESSARLFACNAVAAADAVVTGRGCEDLVRPLADRGYKLRMLDLSEFMKSGGSAKCLTLRLPAIPRPDIPAKPVPAKPVPAKPVPAKPVPAKAGERGTGIDEVIDNTEFPPSRE